MLINICLKSIDIVSKYLFAYENEFVILYLPEKYK